DVVAIEQEGVAAVGEQPLVDEVGDGRLAGPGQAGEPQHQRLLALQGGAFGAADVERLPLDVGGPAQGEADQAGAGRLIGLAVDQDQAAEVAAVGVGLEGQGRVEVQVADGDVVELERAGREVFAGLDIDPVADVGDL